MTVTVQGYFWQILQLSFIHECPFISPHSPPHPTVEGRICNDKLLFLALIRNGKNWVSVAHSVALSLLVIGPSDYHTGLHRSVKWTQGSAVQCSESYIRQDDIFCLFVGHTQGPLRQDSETGWTGELWSNRILLKLEN